MWIRTHLKRRIVNGTPINKDTLVNLDHIRSIGIHHDPQPGEEPNLLDLRAYGEKHTHTLATEEGDEPRLTRLLYNRINEALAKGADYLDLNSEDEADRDPAAGPGFTSGSFLGR